MPKKGRKGIEQRVKGNVKTASSGRMAELLGGDGGAFIGFDAVSGGAVGGGGGNGEGEGMAHSAGVEFQVVMKQLGKRDTTTKLKALQEFALQCDREPTESVLSVLHVWTLMYNKLSMDNDNRVREASHKAMKSCAVKVKNAFAPHLKSVVGCWVSGMCDPYGPATSAAEGAFTAAFSTPKQGDVFQFTFKAILRHVEEVALKQNPDTFSDPRVVPSDEREQRYERAVTMALHGLSLTLRRLPKDYIAENRADWEQLLSEKKLWKLSKHQNPFLRASVYSLLTAICLYTRDFVPSRGKQFSPLVLGSLGEGDCVVMGPLWEAALLIIAKDKSWSEHVNITKAVLPGLWSLLSAGGYGSAVVTYPCLLPLLNKLVEQVFSSDVNFAVSFLERMKDGLQGDYVRSSRSQCGAVLQSFTECFIYLLLHVKPPEEEEGRFFHSLLTLVVELLEYSLCACPQLLRELTFAAIARLLERLLQARLKNAWLEEPLTKLQAQIIDTMTQLLKPDPDSKLKISRIGELLKLFSRQNKAAVVERKSVRFSAGEAEATIGLRSTAEEKKEQEEEDEGQYVELVTARDSAVKEKPKHDSTSPVKLDDFIRPIICSVCASCTTAVCSSSSLEHSDLLCTLLRFYSSKTFVKGLISSLERTNEGLSTGQSSTEQCSSLLTLCTSLLKVVDFEEICFSEESRKLAESVVETVILLTYTGGVAPDSAALFLSEVAKEHPPVLPLILLKLNKAGQKEGILTLLNLGCRDTLLTLLGSTCDTADTIFLRKLLELMLTAAVHGTSFAGLEIVGAISSRVCELLETTFQQSTPAGFKPGEKGDGEEEVRMTVANARKLLEIATKMEPSIVEDYEVTKVLSTLLHWSFNNMDVHGEHRELLPAVARCYVHLLSTLPGLDVYLQSLSSIMVGHDAKGVVGVSLARTLQVALMFRALHSGVMNSAKAFWDTYHSLVVAAASTEEPHIPLPGLDSFCRGLNLYSPLFEDLPSESICSTLSYPTVLSLLPAVALCEPTLLLKGIPLQGTDLERGSAAAATGTEWSLEGIAGSGAGDRSVELEVVFLADLEIGEDGREEEEERIRKFEKKWKLVVISLTLAICQLRKSHLKENSPLESHVSAIIHSALERCLVVGSRRMTWIKSLVNGVMDRASMDGPVWCLLLRQLFASLERVFVNSNQTSLKETISFLFVEPEPSALQMALSGLTSSLSASLYREQALSLPREREGDVCLLVGCLLLLPESDELISQAARSLTVVAEQQSSSELSLFESVVESCQDPFSFSVLELIQLLVDHQRVPQGSWDFILCTLVTLIQLLTEGGEVSTVNHTVLYCHTLRLCSAVGSFLTSPDAPADQATEWREFFQPSLQENLLPSFFKEASQSSRLTTDFCRTYQQFYLSRVVGHLCTSPDISSLQELLNTILSPFYPIQAASFLLARRVFSNIAITLTEDQPADPKRTVLSVRKLQEMLGERLEQLDLDVVFLEDSHTGTASGHVHGSCPTTTAYVFIWLIAIEAMGQCDSEARGVMVDWLKEQALFDHLLHGLFKFLNETTSIKELKYDEVEVSFSPDLEQLSCVAYSAVARQLPSMLRQWYLSLDRQTSTLVSKFTVKHISPALQQTELQAIGKSNRSVGNMEVRVHSGASEVSVVYRVDEFSIELSVCLPDNYPLQPPTIREGKRARIDMAQWRKWMLQLNVFVANQNGSLMDGLLLWKSNLDKHFSGVEDCMICFSVIHGSNFSLPKMVCRTCKKKFHSACLYKWFNTSTKSTCPLCRNIF